MPNMVHTAILFKSYDKQQELINKLKKSDDEFSFQWLIPAKDTYQKLELWGTKWDACNVDNNFEALEFDTPWNEPGIEIFEKMAELCPDISFTARYAYDDYTNAGSYNYDSENPGIVDSYECEPYTDECDRFIKETFGYDPMEDSDGNEESCNEGNEGNEDCCCGEDCSGECN